MASTISSATLTVTLTEAITLNGSPQGAANTLSIGSIKEIYKRIVRCIDDSDCTIATFQTGVNTADNAIDLEDVRYLRLTNLDDTNNIDISLQTALAEGGTANASASILIEPGKSFMMGSVHDGISVDDDAATIVTALNDLESILMNPGTNAVDVEIFVASV